MKWIKSWIGLHLAVILTVLGVIIQAGEHYLSQHPKVTASGFFAACGLALFNFFQTSWKSKL